MADTITIKDTPTDELRTYYANLAYAPQGSKASARRVRILRRAIELTLEERGEAI